MKKYFDLSEKTRMKKMYEDTYQKVYNYFYYLTLHRDWTEDLISKTYLRVLEKYSLYCPEKGGILTWILAIARNIWMDECRAAGKETWMGMDQVEEGIFAGDSAEMEQSENRMLLETLISVLNEKERMVVAMRYGVDFSYQEIAECTGLSEKNVSVILSRSLRKMRLKSNEVKSNEKGARINGKNECVS